MKSATIESPSIREPIANSTMRLFFAPFYGDNPYQRNLIDALERLGVRVNKEDVGDDKNRLWEKVARKRPDLLHLHWTHEYLVDRSWLKSLLRVITFLRRLRRARESGLKIIWTVHNLTSHDQKEARLQRYAHRRIASLVDAIIVHSDLSARLVTDTLGPFPSRRLHVVPHGNYIDSYPQNLSKDEARRELGLTSSQPLFLFFGRIHNYKGVDELVASFQRANLAARSLLVIAGQNAFEPAIEPAKWQEHPGVHLYAEYIPDARVQTFMQAADVVVLPYRSILTSGSALLAMSFAKPVIAPRLGDLPDLIGDDGGLLYDPDRPNALTEALSRFADDPKAYERCGRENLRKATACSWDHVAKLTYEIYRSV